MFDYLRAIKLYTLNRNKVWSFQITKLSEILSSLDVARSTSKRSLHLACFFNLARCSLVNYMDSHYHGVCVLEARKCFNVLENFSKVICTKGKFFISF